MGLREEKKRRQRQAILDTAVGLFREQGFERTRVSDVTERLSISEVTFFNYFATKGSVLEAAADDMLDRATALLRHDVADDTRPVPERLEELVRAFAVNFAGDREFSGPSPSTSPAIASSRPCSPPTPGSGASGTGRRRRSSSPACSSTAKAGARSAATRPPISWLSCSWP